MHHNMMVVLPRPAGAWCVQDSLHWAADGTDWTGKLTMLHGGGGGLWNCVNGYLRGCVLRSDCRHPVVKAAEHHD